MEGFECSLLFAKSCPSFGLKTKLETTKKGNLSLKDNFLKIKNLVDSLAATGKKISQDDHVLHILKGLGSEYDSTVNVITEKDVTPSLQKVYSLMLTQESRIGGIQRLIQMVLYPL